MCASMRYFAIGRGVIRAAARAGHHGARWLRAQPRAELAQQRRVLRRAVRSPRAAPAAASWYISDGRVHDAALSSATKS